MPEEQKSIHGKEVVKTDCLLIRYEGPSFESRMELHAFIKQISSVEDVLKETIYQLSETQKIIDEPKEPKIYLELRKGSFETVLLIVFSHPVLINVVSDCISSYLKYLSTGLLNRKYKREIENLVQNQAIRNATRDIINPCIQDSDKATIINGDVNLKKCNVFIMDKSKRRSITNKLQSIESNIPIAEHEREMYGKILKINAVKAEDKLSKSKFGFVPEGASKPVETAFGKDISEKELKDILFSRVKISATALYRGDDIIKITINSYALSPVKTLSDY